MGTENIPPNTGAPGSVSQNLSQMALVDHVDHMDWTNVPGRRIYENGPVVVENILYTQFGEVRLISILEIAFCSHLNCCPCKTFEVPVVSL